MNDKQILITGATNGIGLAAVEALAALGANLAIVGRSKTRTRIASARIRAAAGREATVATFITSGPSTSRRSNPQPGCIFHKSRSANGCPSACEHQFGSSQSEATGCAAFGSCRREQLVR